MDKKVITIIDYGMGNIGSLENMILKVGGMPVITSDYRIIQDAEKLLLPGVGAFDNGINCLQNLKLIDVLNEQVLVKKKPILCICLGMQLITNSSQEGVLKGLGWIDAETVKFDFNNSQSFRIPHMGWNDIFVKGDSTLFRNLPDEPYFYFVHSYHLMCNDISDIAATSIYCYEFVSAIQKNNIFGTQFHPEKSHKYGLKVVENFVNL